MRVLVACEESQVVTIAFRNKGHEAYSCDIIPCSGGFPQWHIQDDVRKVLNDGWDMMIAHPPCTYLTVSNNKAIAHGCSKYTKEEAKELQADAIRFFMMFVKCKIPKWGIENPIGIMSTEYRKPNQVIQPWMYGHGETKATCLWLRGLPRLNGFNVVEGREQRLHYLPPSADRAKLRSKTFEGIAQAMADQWGSINELKKAI